MDYLTDSDDDDEGFFSDHEELPGGTLPQTKHFDKLRKFFRQFREKMTEIEDITNDTVLDTWDEAPRTAPVFLNTRTEEEGTGLFDMINTENVMFNKYITVFAILSEEIEKIHSLVFGKFLGPLIVYGERPNSADQELANGEAEVQIGRMLGLFQEIYETLKRSNSIALNMVHQLGVLYKKKEPLYDSTFKYTHFEYGFGLLGKLFRIFHTVDCVIDENENLKDHWAYYKRMMKFVKADPQKFNVEPLQVKFLEKSLVKFDKTLMSSGCLDVLFNQNYGSPKLTQGKQLVDLPSNKEFKEEYKYILHKLFNEFEKPGSQIEDRRKMIDLLCLMRFYFQWFPDSKEIKKLFKSLWSFQKKMPIIVLVSHVSTSIYDFCAKHMESFLSKVKSDPKDIANLRRDYLSKVNDQFPAEVTKLYMGHIGWAAKMNSVIMAPINQKLDPFNTFRRRADLIMQALGAATTVKNLVSTVIIMHLNEGIPIERDNIIYYSMCFEILKSIEFEARRCTKAISETYGLIVRVAQQRCDDILREVHARIERKKGKDKEDAIAAVALIRKLQRGPVTRVRNEIGKICRDIAKMKSVLREDEVEDLDTCIYVLDKICFWQHHLYNTTTCDFLYWARDIIPACFDILYTRPDEFSRIAYLVRAINDPTAMLRSSLHLEENPELLDSYKEEMVENFDESILKPLAKEIEDDLRFQIHTIFLEHLDKKNPNKSGVRDLQKYLLVEELDFFDYKILIKNRVSAHLNRTFYNMTTLALNDWKTYEQMRYLARDKYKLDLLEGYLPPQTLEQGIDVIDIMRNIDTFVDRFKYNLHTQVFIEVPKEPKHINTVSIEQIVNSLRTHGEGIINTTVNATYHYLIVQFTRFTNFLVDDLIHSPLLKESNYWKNNKDKHDKKYPFERAENTVREIRRITTFEDNKTFLDKFRTLITEIGNALGYIRMIRTASLNRCSQAINYVPNLGKIQKFSEMAEKDELPEETQTAAKNLDNTLNALSTNFSRDQDFFRLLVDVFEGVLTTDDQKHLKVFYTIIPPLTINFVEHMLVGRDILATKKNAANAFISDDGFAIGLAYILRLLHQNQKFESLRWFQGLKEKYAEDHARVLAETERSRRNRSGETNLRTNENLSLRKIAQYQEEFELLSFCFDAAKIFFEEF